MSEIDKVKEANIQRPIERTDPGVIPVKDVQKPPLATAPRPPQRWASSFVLLRKPPPLELKDARPVKKNGIQMAFLDGMSCILDQDTDFLAYTTAELLVRREKAILQSDDEEAKLGMGVLNNIVRMFEHLSIMQTNTETE